MHGFLKNGYVYCVEWKEISPKVLVSDPLDKVSMYDRDLSRLQLRGWMGGQRVGSTIGREVYHVRPTGKLHQ